MKKIFLLVALVLTSVMFKAANAQVSVNVNIGSQPVWGPIGYDYVENYYFPDGDFYYNVPRGEYVYFDGRDWVFSLSLPGRWSNFDLYNSYKVVINERNPYYRNDYYRSTYGGYRGRRQEIIYNSRDPRYYVIANHPEHARWMESRRFDNDRRNVYNNPGRFEGRNERPDFGRNDNGRNYGGMNNRNFDQRRNESMPNRGFEQRGGNDARNSGMEQRRNEGDRSNVRTVDQRRNDGNRGFGGRRG